VVSGSPSGSIKYDYSLMAIAEVNITRLILIESHESKYLKRTHNTSPLQISDVLNRECADGNDELHKQLVLKLLHAEAQLIVPEKLGKEIQANKLEKSSSTHDSFLKKLMDQYENNSVEHDWSSIYLSGIPSSFKNRINYIFKTLKFDQKELMPIYIKLTAIL
jgi:hypothetical protein